MKPKEKAKELVEKFLLYVDWMDLIDDCINRKTAVRNAKQCALIAVDEIIMSINPFGQFLLKGYWEKVRIEIKNFK